MGHDVAVHIAQGTGKMVRIIRTVGIIRSENTDHLGYIAITITVPSFAGNSCRIAV